MTRSRYLPIEDHAAIGNLRTVALVALDGSIDWCCFPEMDSPSVFAAILDADRGGSFRVAPVGADRGEQQYEEGSNVLHTRFRTASGRLTVTDFMPLSGDIHGVNCSRTAPELYRLLRCEGGDVEVEIEWAPRFDYARAPTRLQPAGGGWVATAGNGDGRLVLGGVETGEVEEDDHGPRLRSRVSVRSGEPLALVCRWGDGAASVSVDRCMEVLEETVAVWRDWLDGGESQGQWAGRHQPLIVRSALALKLLTHGETGAIAAAPTTSLPETIGGHRNWDYRFSWIRDSGLTAQALQAMGHSREALEFLQWAERAAAGQGEREWGVQIMYGLRGQNDLSEYSLEHLEGYRCSPPVRIGNGAHDQLQLDIYGELLDAAYELHRHQVELEPHVRRMLKRVADRACAQWDQPDWGIWEVRSGTEHFVHSKLMIWVALDRAVRMAHLFEDAEPEVWSRKRDLVRAALLDQGVHPETGAFVRSFGNDSYDASNLRIPLEGFLPARDPRVQATVDATLRELTENGLVHRYHADDGLEGEEGAFVLCSFWLVDVLALSGRLDEAHEIFESLVGRVNHVGLLAEQVDPESGIFLGNFPQAFSHIGLINSSLYLAHAEGRETPAHPLHGSAVDGVE
jgi:GH15 family glucan-1,4-alpha-glucosidase